MLEKYIGGQEIQVAVMNGKAIGAIELKPLRGFYDYKAKYRKSAKTTHIMPANISKKKYNEVLKLSEKTHSALGCRGVTRSDFKFFKNKFFLLEINTQPGMTNLSLVPEIAKYSGLNPLGSLSSKEKVDFLNRIDILARKEPKVKQVSASISGAYSEVLIA